MHRRTYIDWLRGVAVLLMIEWHAIDAWTAIDERVGWFFGTLAFLGGWAAPLFLFLAGLALPLAMDSHMRKGRSAREASWMLQKRGWQIWVIAHIFRFQSYVMNPWAVWHSVLKPDILNILGLGMVMVAFCWGRSQSMRGRMGWLLGPALLVLILGPLALHWPWPALLHPRAEAYIRPNGGFGVFTLFPWTAFVFAGAAIGVWIAKTRTPEEDRRFHAGLAAVGAATVAAGFVGMWLPTPLETNFWTNSWSFFLMRTGAMTLLLAGAWLWYQRPATGRWSPIVLFGQTSLFVYWVHIEIAYGIVGVPLKKSLTVPQAFVAYLVLTMVMLWLANWWRNRTGPWIPAHMRAPAVVVLLLLCSAAALGASQAQWRPVAVRLPPGVPVAAVSACVTEAGVAGMQPSETGRLRISFTEKGEPPTTVVMGTVYFEGPGPGSRQRSVSVFDTPLELGAMPHGRYRFSVVAQSATSVLVASRVHEATLSAADPVVSFTVDLIKRNGSARVLGATGAPVAGAHFYTSPSSVNSTADDEEQINLATIAPGTALTIRTIEWGVTCHRVTDAETQTIVVPDAPEPLVIVTPTTPTSSLPQRRHILPSPRLAGALVSGIPGSDCPVPYEHLPVTLARVNGRTEHTLLLPLGTYTIRLLDGTTLRASAPGRIELR